MESRFPLNGFRIQYVARFQTSVGYRIPLANIFWISLLDEYLAFIVASINFLLSNKCVLDKFAVIVDSAVDVLHEIHRVEEAGIPTEYDKRWWWWLWLLLSKGLQQRTNLDWKLKFMSVIYWRPPEDLKFGHCATKLRILINKMHTPFSSTCRSVWSSHSVKSLFLTLGLAFVFGLFLRLGLGYGSCLLEE